MKAWAVLLVALLAAALVTAQTTSKPLPKWGAPRKKRQALKASLPDNPVSKWYKQVAAKLQKDDLLKQAYDLAAIVARHNITRARAIVKVAKGMVAMKQYTEVAIQDLKDPLRVTPKKGQQASCEQGQDFLIELKYRQNRWEQRQYIIKKNIWQAAIDDKIVGGVFARSVGVDTPSILWCSARVSRAARTRTLCRFLLSLCAHSIAPFRAGCQCAAG